MDVFLPCCTGVEWKRLLRSAKASTRLTMRQYAGQSLSARPAFLLASRLPYDDLLRSPQSFARRLHGRTLRSLEGGEAAGGAVLQRRVLVPMECLCRVIGEFGSFFCDGNRTCHRVSPAD